MSGAAAARATTRAVIGRGCDPARARFVERQWPALLHARVVCTTSDKELIAALQRERFDVFFLAPGVCALTAAGRYAGGDTEALVRRIQPHIKIVHVYDVAQAIPVLSAALGDAGAPRNIAPLTEDWPFVD